MLQPDFGKSTLLPAIVQDARNGCVLMLGYMNEAALEETQQSKRVTFYSRSKQRLWTKGEQSGNFLNLQSIKLDCDRDTFLIQAIPEGPTCHMGNTSCFGEDGFSAFSHELDAIVEERAKAPESESYTAQLLAKGPKKVAQKVGEEGVEVALEGIAGPDDLLLNEAADLVYHLLVLLKSRGLGLKDVEDVLEKRHAVSKSSATE